MLGFSAAIPVSYARNDDSRQYVMQLMSCARGLVANTIAGPVYWRGGESSTRKVATVGEASITYQIPNVRLIKGALRGLGVSAGSLNPAFFTASNAFYAASVPENANAIAITPTVLAPDHKGMTINGVAVRSGDVEVQG